MHQCLCVYIHRQHAIRTYMSVWMYARILVSKYRRNRLGSELLCGHIYRLVHTCIFVAHCKYAWLGVRTMLTLVYSHIYTHTVIYVLPHPHICTNTLMYLYIHTHACACTRTHAYVYPRTPACICRHYGRRLVGPRHKRRDVPLWCLQGRPAHMDMECMEARLRCQRC